MVKLFHDKEEVDCFIYSPVECHESEFADHPVEEQVVVPIFMFDDIADVVDFPKYDEYDDDYIVDFEVDFSEQAAAFSPLGNDDFQQSQESSQPAYFSYDNDEENEESTESGEGNTLPLCFSSFQLLKENFHSVISQQFHSYANEHGENNEFVDGNSLPLCFASFKLLRENFETINEVEECGMIQSHLDSMGKIDNELQQSPLVFHDPIVDYIEGLNSQNLQLLANYQSGNEDDKDLVLQPTSFSCPAGVSFQNSYEYFQYFHDNHQLDLHGSRMQLRG
jgi:hypothetical protein